MPRDDSAYLLDMLLAARDAVSFTEGMSYDEFALDRRTQLSVLKSMEIVGEAAAHVKEEHEAGASRHPVARDRRHAQPPRACLL